MKLSEWTKTTFEQINEELATVGAKTTLKLKCLQPKSDGYIGEAFKDIDKPVYDYQIVDSNGHSFANDKSYLYRSEDGRTPEVIRKFAFGGYYVETSKAIYIG